MENFDKVVKEIGLPGKYIIKKGKTTIIEATLTKDKETVSFKIGDETTEFQPNDELEIFPNYIRTENFPEWNDRKDKACVVEYRLVSVVKSEVKRPLFPGYITTFFASGQFSDLEIIVKELKDSLADFTEKNRGMIKGWK